MRKLPRYDTARRVGPFEGRRFAIVVESLRKPSFPPSLSPKSSAVFWKLLLDSPSEGAHGCGGAAHLVGKDAVAGQLLGVDGLMRAHMNI
jgi:hypothetical protein